MTSNPRTEILAEAERLVNHDRDVQHGSPTANFGVIAHLWSGYLGIALEPHQVAWMMVLLKAARSRHDPENRDNYADAAGYIACGWDVVMRDSVRNLHASTTEPPDAPVPTWSVGDKLYGVEDYDDLPVGTVVNCPEWDEAMGDPPFAYRATKLPDGRWDVEGGPTHPSGLLADGYPDIITYLPPECAGVTTENEDDDKENHSA